MNIKYKNNLKECRNNVNLKQTEVAKSLGFKSPDRISRWEKGNAYPHIKNLFKLAKLYEVSIEKLYKELTK